MATFKYFITPEAGEFCFGIKCDSPKKIKIIVSVFKEMHSGDEPTMYPYEDLNNIDDYDLLYGDLSDVLVIQIKDIIDLDYLNDIIKSTKLKVLLIGT